MHQHCLKTLQSVPRQHTATNLLYYTSTFQQIHAESHDSHDIAYLEKEYVSMEEGFSSIYSNTYLIKDNLNLVNCNSSGCTSGKRFSMTPTDVMAIILIWINLSSG